MSIIRFDFIFLFFFIKSFGTFFWTKKHNGHIRFTLDFHCLCMTLWPFFLKKLSDYFIFLIWYVYRDTVSTSIIICDSGRMFAFHEYWLQYSRKYIYSMSLQGQHINQTCSEIVRDNMDSVAVNCFSLPEYFYGQIMALYAPCFQVNKIKHLYTSQSLARWVWWTYR